MQYILGLTYLFSDKRYVYLSTVVSLGILIFLQLTLLVNLPCYHYSKSDSVVFCVTAEMGFNEKIIQLRGYIIWETLGVIPINCNV